jgi:hypothetical protein
VQDHIALKRQSFDRTGLGGHDRRALIVDADTAPDTEDCAGRKRARAGRALRGWRAGREQAMKRLVASTASNPIEVVAGAAAGAVTRHT